MGKYLFEERLWQIIPQDYLNEYEKEELVDLIAGFDRSLDELIIQQVAAIWPVSSALCFSVLEDLESTLCRITPLQVPEWVREILEVFETDGLRAARSFMADEDNIYFQRLRGQGALSFDQVSARLLPYVQGLANRNLMLEQADNAGTDTSTIFLPREISVFPREQQNFLLYKLIATFQWAFVKQDLYCHKTAGNHIPFCEDLARHLGTTPTSQDIVLEYFLNCFPRPEIAQEIYHLLQTVRVVGFLAEYLPGLMKDARFIFKHLAEMQHKKKKTNEPGVLTDIGSRLLLFCSEDIPLDIDGATGDIITAVISADSDSLDVMRGTTELYNICVGEGEQERFSPFVFQGILNSLSAHRARLSLREEHKQHFIEALAAILLPQTDSEQKTSENEKGQLGGESLLEDGISMTLPKTGEKEDNKSKPDEIRYIRIDDNDIELPEELHDLATDIAIDLGGIPSAYIDSAQKMAGGGFAGQITHLEEDTSEIPADEKTYDEWDYRRQGFRKNWCRLIERKVHATKGSFVSNTLEKYRGQIIQLKRQFEMMRTQHRFVKRQRDGDDIDIEALTVALGDSRAGQSPSDRLFIRLLRDERDIATLFLVDMSSSTEGWVGNALKESLLILCEALEALGDQYAIYGFSGMRRSRNIVFHVKDFEETYNSEIRGRIAAIAPIDYTRMGTPIRHFTEVLKQIDSKVRLLIILTDGKPEDYDDYKGEYAIEDTRHALIEAKSAGIHPFCITIDKEAQDYMAHMLGEINYAFINNVKKLPLRVPEIYRTLTS